jgi:hypothetical protein
MVRMIAAFLVILLLNSLKAASQLNSRPKIDSLPPRFSLAVLPQNFYNQHLGFFCKKEAVIQKLTSVNVFFRLGTKEYVDRIEGKAAGYKLQAASLRRAASY